MLEIGARGTAVPVDECSTSALTRYKLEDRLEFSGGAIETGLYDWSHDPVDVWTSRDYYLHVCLSSQPGAAWGMYLDAERVAGTIGKVLFVPPGRLMRSGGCRGVQRSFQCFLAPAWIEQLLECQPVWRDRALAEGLCLNCPDVDRYLLSMYEELRRPGFATLKVVEAAATGLSVAIARKFRLNWEEPYNSVGGLAPWRMRLIRDRASADAPTPTVEVLADLCRMSVRHLSREFKTETGITIGTYIAGAQVKRAHALLNDTDQPVSEIARILGFTTSGAFSHAFRRATGMKPSEARARRKAP